MSDLNIKSHLERLSVWIRWHGPVSFCSSQLTTTINSENNGRSNQRKILKGSKKKENSFDILELEEQHRGMASYILSPNRKMIFFDPSLAKESYPDVFQLPLLDQRALKTHGNLCTTAAEALFFSAASETSFFNGQIQCGQPKGPTTTTGPALETSLCIQVWDSFPPLGDIRVAGVTDERLYQNNCSHGPETFCLHLDTSWTSGETSSRDPATTNICLGKCFLSQRGREILLWQVSGPESLFIPADLRLSIANRHLVIRPSFALSDATSKDQ